MTWRVARPASYSAVASRYVNCSGGSLGSSYASFGSDGSKIYYEIEHQVFEVEFEPGPSPVLGTPQEFMQVSAALDGYIVVERDGQNILAVQTSNEDEDEDSPPRRRGIKVVQNWTRGIPGR